MCPSPLASECASNSIREVQLLLRPCGSSIDSGRRWLSPCKHRTLGLWGSLGSIDLVKGSGSSGGHIRINVLELTGYCSIRSSVGSWIFGRLWWCGRVVLRRPRQRQDLLQLQRQSSYAIWAVQFCSLSLEVVGISWIPSLYDIFVTKCLYQIPSPWNIQSGLLYRTHFDCQTFPLCFCCILFPCIGPFFILLSLLLLML